MPETTKRLDRAEIAKRVERAEKLLQKGKTADALEEYQQVLDADPQNDSARQMAAELYLSLQRTPEAVKLLSELFERQVDAGDNTRASLTYKKLTRYSNPSSAQKVRFGQILETSNRKLALETYESSLEDLAKQGRRQEVLAVLKRMVALEPLEKNLRRLAEQAAELEDHKTAAGSFLKMAEMTAASGGDPSSWYERAYGEDPNDPAIVLGYSKALLSQGQVGAVIFVLEALVRAGNAGADIRETYAKALLAASRFAEAAPLVWQLFEQNPSRLQDVIQLMGALIDAQQDAEAVALARKLDQYQRGRGDRRAFVAMMQELSSKHRASTEMLEFLSELFNASNRENDYSQTLLKLFDLHCSMGNFAKAAECLDRAADVDSYEPGHQKRLELLRGKIDDNRFKVIASRFTSVGKKETEQTKTENAPLGTGTLQDLMLQAEILVQYGMKSKAIERLQRIQELFPHEEERNDALLQLYHSAGMTPRYMDSTPAPTAAATAKLSLQAAAAPRAPVGVPESDVSSFARVAEITRKLYRQSNADAVMTSTVQEIGAQWNVNRCIVAMRKPGLLPSAVKEYCSEGLKKGEGTALARLVATVQDEAVARGSLMSSDAGATAELQPVREILAQLGIASLLAIPLSDGVDHLGVLILTQDTPRGWHSNDVVVLKTLCDQIVIALNNAGLRRLVKSLSVTDEQSGLLKRASYLDLLMAETKRAIQQSTPLTVVLVQFSRAASLLKEHGENRLEEAMQRVGQIFAANIRQNDLAFRYEINSIALILGETAEREAGLALEKLRKVCAELTIGDGEAFVFSAGIAEAVVRQQFDSADVVTEVINRAELALDMALAQGPGKFVPVAAQFASAAVA
ncbi:MAG: hypothetical protein DMG91_11045 [Acidobacteria bacterium]|nr:MAG: hypothetical protein DMG91_11045 [Acidobacteriota bacterium]